MTAKIVGTRTAARKISLGLWLAGTSSRYFQSCVCHLSHLRKLDNEGRSAWWGEMGGWRGSDRCRWKRAPQGRYILRRRRLSGRPLWMHSCCHPSLTDKTNDLWLLLGPVIALQSPVCVWSGLDAGAFLFSGVDFNGSPCLMCFHRPPKRLKNKQISLVLIFRGDELT